MSNRRFSPTHEWCELTENTLTLGITEYKNLAIGKVIGVKLAEAESEMVADSVCGEFQGINGHSKLRMPMTGKIVQVNTKILDELDLLNQNPLDEAAWLLKIQVVSPEHFQKLLFSEEQYRLSLDI